MQDAQDVDADVDADEIRQGERTHGVGHAELKDLVDGFGSGHALHDGEGGFVDQRHEHAVGDEAGRIVDLDGRLAELCGEVADGFVGGLVGLQAANDFYKRHNRDRVEEVHPNNLRGPGGLCGELGDGDGAGVGGQDGFFR